MYIEITELQQKNLLMMLEEVNIKGKDAQALLELKASILKTFDGFTGKIEGSVKD